MSIHTIFLPPGMSAEQVVEHISRGVKVPCEGLTEADGDWVSVEIAGGELRDGFWRDGRFVRVLPAGDTDA